ncbi:tail assembly chaperone [Dorea sp. D27]|uniref:tail assembly chaperone n=1 Tax=Dorea sp. D27 TaxID=658665 RepID=UPI0018DDEF4B|nr:tail assembly chaperone [Dorea sp. D27]
MMTLDINGKECELNFGIGFIRDLDKKYFVQSKSGMKFGNGLEIKIPLLLVGDVVTLAEFIHMGTARMDKRRPSMQEIDDFIDRAEDIDAVFSEVIDELKKSNACKRKLQEMEKELKEVEEGLKG